MTAFEGLSTEETLRTAGVFNILRTLPAFIGGEIEEAREREEDEDDEDDDEEDEEEDDEDDEDDK